MASLAWANRPGRDPIGDRATELSLGAGRGRAALRYSKAMGAGQSPPSLHRSKDEALGGPSEPRWNWMFYGSDAHAQSAVAAFSIIASCRLHSLDPEQYLDEVLRVLPYWPKARYLQLAPNHWATTRAKLRSDELDAPLCSFTVPAA